MADKISFYNILCAGRAAHKLGKSGILKSKDGYSVFYANDNSEIDFKAQAEKINLVLVDESFPGLEMLRLTVKLRSVNSEMAIICLTKNPNGQYDALWRYGIDDLISESCHEIELKYRIKRALEMHRLSSFCSDLKTENHDLLTLSQTDGMTRLFNRRHFNILIDIEFARIKRYGGRMGCLMLDIDHFKKVNDNYGHLIGDQVLQQIAKIIQTNLRTIDIPARYGGEEFVLILPETAERGIEVVGKKLLSSIGNNEFVSKTNPELAFPTHITVSIGASRFPHKDITTAEILLNSADQAMYNAKRSGRNRLVLDWDN